jgi:hypothetical protein
MYSRFAPLNGSTVRFAKDYRAQQVRAADVSRPAQVLKQPRRSVRSWLS